MYFGIFKELRSLNLPDSHDMDLYEGYYSEFYEALTERTEYDVELLAEQAERVRGQGRILELACGAGRVLIQLARRGHSTLGLDLSPDMLALYRRKSVRLPENVRDLIEVGQADMTSFAQAEKFPLIVLSATSVSLLPDMASVEKMLETVYAHLEEGGRFVFDYVYENSEHNREMRDGKVDGVTIDLGPDHKQFVLMGEHEEHDSRKAVMNFYAEVVQGGSTRRYFGSTSKSFFPEAQILDCVNRSSLKLIETHTYPADQAPVRCLVLEKGKVS
ncbi:daptide-type RiPP biosynthesis methyltransferase [Saccharibacillus sacchari]|uniref:daptide-type RiPP biosynthesis methyltransferase n=1 Tax=Saccharibacillus sacchari TaxID=456493 RepID=UPI0004B15C68|nr:daptide-type RiPP biosynthesis methyltransferase [Saccharibacillus sacchari]